VIWERGAVGSNPATPTVWVRGVHELSAWVSQNGGGGHAEGCFYALPAGVGEMDDTAIGAATQPLQGELAGG